MSYAVGDKVQIAFEGTVTYVTNVDHWIDVELGEGVDAMAYTFDTQDELVKLRKVEPPAVTFIPGDSVRDTVTGKLYSVGTDGYFDHSTGNYLQIETAFTSASYAKVDVSEAGSDRALRETNR